ncbi:MAG: hypothetical protein B7Z15_07120 [Rhizobiales bacterium 32-66-8]|nr:MAG: hypothetical protein B7Z15_07120 [Rhizobiales bacterium 32-66-8]
MSRALPGVRETCEGVQVSAGRGAPGLNMGQPSTQQVEPSECGDPPSAGRSEVLKVPEQITSARSNAPPGTACTPVAMPVNSTCRTSR